MTNSVFVGKRIWWTLLVLAPIAAALGIWIHAGPCREAVLEPEQVQSLSPAEFSRLIQDFSEEEGYFRSDNFTSNETSYLHVVDKLREMHISGGAYLGVGPEQNFTYIAKIRPRIAFIVDIRRQAVIQHLLYKALFHTSRSRAEFLSNLLSRPLAGESVRGKGAFIERLLEYFGSASAPEETFAANLATIRRIIQQQFQIPLSDRDQQRLEYVYSTFRKHGLEISFQTGRSSWGGRFGGFPNLRDIILQPDLSGNLGNFLATEEDYRFVRELHMRNCIIPVVGDFAGPKALAAIGRHLRKYGFTVRAFYTSNVEQFLFQNGSFGAFVNNVQKLPIDAGSVFIRAISTRGALHPAYVPGHRTATVLQKISLFLTDYEEGAYTSYWKLAMTHFIAGP